MNKDLIIKRLTDKQAQVYNAAYKRMQTQEYFIAGHICRDTGLDQSVVRQRLAKLISMKLIAISCKKFTYKYITI